MKVVQLAAALLAVAFASMAEAQVAPIVRTQSGAVRGEARGDGTMLFQGIPFAAPPVGDLRWRPPQAVARWRGVRAATQIGPACAQNRYGWNDRDADRSSEDCLYLDIRTPRLDPRARLPVLVWIHGGSNRAGSSAGKVLATFPTRGVVMVGVQYRLGAFGFIAHPALTAESSRHASGNYGLMDQIAALAWVRANIARFGGDPRRVAIAGDSAGGQDANTLLVAPPARGLFARAIAESGTAQFGMPARSLRANEAIGLDLQRLLHAPDLAAMRRASTAQVLAADLALPAPANGDPSYLWLQMSVDGDVLPSAPHDLLAAGLSADAPLLIGSNARELALPGGPDNLEHVLRMAFGGDAVAARRLYGFGATPQNDARLGDAFEQVANDVTFRCPAVETARLHARAGRAVYQYHFDFGAEVRHGAELSLVSNNTPVGVFEGHPVTMQDYWVNFIKTGDPNGPGLPRWPRFAEPAQDYLEFGESGPVAKSDLRRDICRLLPRL